MTDKMPDEIYVQWGTLEKDVGIFSTRFSGDVYHSDPKYKALQERCERLEEALEEFVWEFGKLPAGNIRQPKQEKIVKEKWEKTLQTIREASDAGKL